MTGYWDLNFVEFDEAHPVIDGELVDAPRVLAAEPAGPPPQLRCARHPAWLRCDLSWDGCVQHSVPADIPDERTWEQRRNTYRVVDRRRPGVHGWS